MPYDEQLAARVRKALGKRRGLTEKKMFGGLAFLLHGKMCCGVEHRDLVVRVGPAHYASALAKPGARPMDFTGRPLTGFVYVAPTAVKGDAALLKWVEQGLSFARSRSKKQ